MVLATLLTLVPVMASTFISTQYEGSGDTSYNSYTSVSGYDWTEGSMQVTATHQLEIMNDGDLSFVQNHNNPGQWELLESFQGFGSGDTEITKDVNWWTEDSTVECCSMKWPTEANIYTWFETDTTLDVAEVHNVADSTEEGPAGEFSHGRFLRNYDTTDDFDFIESTGFGMDLDCSVTPPVPSPPPACEEFCW